MNLRLWKSLGCLLPCLALRPRIGLSMLCCRLPISLCCASIQAHKLGKFFFPALRADKMESSWSPPDTGISARGEQSPGQPWRPPKHWWYTELGVPALIYSVWASCARGLEVQWGRSNESWRSWWEKSYMISEKFLQNVSAGTPVLPPQQAFQMVGSPSISVLPDLSALPDFILTGQDTTLTLCVFSFLPLAISFPWLAISGQLGSRHIS